MAYTYRGGPGIAVTNSVFVVRVNGVQEVGEESLVLLSHATQERMRDVVEKLTEVSQHRVQVLKVSSLSLLPSLAAI